MHIYNGIFLIEFEFLHHNLKEKNDPVYLKIPLTRFMHIRREDIPDIDRKKYLVPCDLTMGQLAYVLRKHSDGLDPSESLFIFISDGKVLAPSCSTIGLLHDHYSREGFLQVEVCLENTFG